MTLKKQALYGVFWVGFQQFSTLGINFGISIILARLLLPKEFGLIAMIGIFMGIGNTLMSAGLGQSLVRTKDANEEDFSTVFFYNLIGSILIYFIIFLAAPFIADFYDQQILINIIRVFSITFLINAFSMVQFTRLTIQMDFKTQMKVSVPSLIISGLCGVLMAYNNYGVWSLVYMSIIGALISTIQIWFWTKWKPVFVFNKEKFKYHFNFGYKLTLSAIIDIIFMNAYVLIIGKFFAPSQVGFYDRANNLKQFPVKNISNILHKVTFPLFAKIKDNDLKLKNIYKRIMKMVIFLIAPILIFMAVLAEPLFRFLLTEKWLPAVPYFQILCFNGILFPIHSYNLNILKVKGRTDLYLKVEIIKKIATIMVIVMTFKFGIYGLLYCSVFLSIIEFFINTHYTNKILNYSSFEQFKDLIPSIILALFCGFFIYYTDYYLKVYLNYDIIRVLIGSLIGSLVYLVIAHYTKMNSLIELINIIKKNR